LALAGCADAPPGTETARKPPASPSLASDSNPLCHARMLAAGRIRSGDNIPVSMRVVNTGRWCFSGMSWSGDTANGTSLVNPPSHGQVRLLIRNDTFLYGYRPSPGYVGSDDFLIAMPSEVGLSTNLAVTVSVRPQVTTAPGG
jgi:hypothetical protein